MIGDKVIVTIVDIRGDKVRLGIQAPNEIPVHRQEVYDAIQRENRAQPGTGPAGGLENKARDASVPSQPNTQTPYPPKGGGSY